MLAEAGDNYETLRDRAAEIVIDPIWKKPKRIIAFVTGRTLNSRYDRRITAHAK